MQQQMQLLVLLALNALVSPVLRQTHCTAQPFLPQIKPQTLHTITSPIQQTIQTNHKHENAKTTRLIRSRPLLSSHPLHRSIPACLNQQCTQYQPHRNIASRPMVCSSLHCQLAQQAVLLTRIAVEQTLCLGRVRAQCDTRTKSCSVAEAPYIWDTATKRTFIQQTTEGRRKRQHVSSQPPNVRHTKQSRMPLCCIPRVVTTHFDWPAAKARDCAESIEPKHTSALRSLLS
jgi:hypothetical protein